MATMSDKYPKFLPEAQSLENWWKLIEVSFTANGVTVEAKKVCIVLTSIPTKYFDDLVCLISPAEPSTLDLTTLKNKLQSICVPKQTIVKAMINFENRKKMKSESYLSFYRELNQLAGYCHFSDKSEFVKFKLFVAAKNEPFFLSKLADLDYKNTKVDDLIKLLCNLESIYNDLKESDSPKVEKAYKVESQHCTVCGKNTHRREKCFFKNATCYNCQEKGHIASTCPSKKNPKKSGKIKEVYEELKLSETEESESGESSFENCEYLSLKSVQVKKDPIMVDLRLNNKNVKFELDTGAAVSTIKMSSLKSFKNIKIEKSKITLKCYNNSSLNVRGTVSFKTAVYKNKTFEDVKFYVIDDDSVQNLIGGDVISKFEMISVNSVKTNDLVNEYKIDPKKPIKNFTAKLFPKSNSQPVFQNARSVPYELKTKIKDSLNQLEKDDILEKVDFAEYASPIVPVLKPDQTVRICGDFRKINNLLHEVKYPLPKISELLDACSGFKYYSKIDLANAYLQISVEEEHRKYLVINTHAGLYRYMRLPFGIHSSGAIFQKFLSQLLKKFENVQVYLDDILICSNSKKEHDQKLAEILKVLKDANIKINFKKSEFQKSKIRYLGFIISDEGYFPDECKILALKEIPRPNGKK